ncbi:MAG TPA: class I SAM-dependent methyltransferase [Mycobacteriales bacterium]
MTTSPTAERTAPVEISLPEQASRLLGHIAGYVGHRTVAIGLRSGLLATLADDATAVTADDLAVRLGLDPFYVAVWCRSAVACGLCDPADAPGSGSGAAGLSGGRYRLAPHAAALLLDATHPGYVGGVFTVLEQDEVFDRFERSLATGERLWWDDCSPDWISGVAATGAPFYTRLVPGGLAQVPGLPARLEAGCDLVDTACGSGAGLERLARSYPRCRVVGVDGDAHSLEQSRQRLADADLLGRCLLVHSPLEDMVLDEPAGCIVNNISMHECRDIDRATERVRAALEPGGWFVISDFPFPDSTDALRSIPGRVMSGIQFFEAQIDDQLLPRSAYPDLLQRHGFTAVDQFDLSGVHTVTHGRTAGSATVG